MSSDKDLFFMQVNNAVLEKMVAKAERRIILITPGLQLPVAHALQKVGERLGNNAVKVFLDASEQALRMGYGDIRAIELLRRRGVLLNHIEHLRYGLVIIDDEGVSFTPNALLLESDASYLKGFNAIKLTADQVHEASIRLCRGTKLFYLVMSKTDEARKKIEAMQSLEEDKDVDEAMVKEMEAALKAAPPTAFDLSRQVRVYCAYLQYVDVKLTGAAIQRKKVTIPKVLLAVSGNNQDLKTRLKTSFELIEQGSKLSSKHLDQELATLKKNFTPSLGGLHGRVILKSNRLLFDERLQALDDKLQAHAKKVEKELQATIDQQIKKVAKYYLPTLQKNPPDEMRGSLGANPDPEQMLRWTQDMLKKAFPCASKMIKKMELTSIYKDVAFEHLDKASFLEALEKAFPHAEWKKKAYKEYIAATERAGQVKLTISH